MYRATIVYVDGRMHYIEAGTIKLLESKCKPFIEYKDTEKIFVDKIETLGYLKHPNEKFVGLVESEKVD